MEDLAMRCCGALVPQHAGSEWELQVQDPAAPVWGVALHRNHGFGYMRLVWVLGPVRFRDRAMVMIPTASPMKGRDPCLREFNITHL